MSALPPSHRGLTPPPPPGLKALLLQRWNAFNDRERVIVATGALLLAVLVVWLIAVRPALRSLAAAPAQRAAVDLQTLRMHAITGEAADLRKVAPVPQGQAEQVLKSATDQLGAKAKLGIQGDHATLTITGASGEDLRQWLVQARGGARVRPLELTLARAPAAADGKESGVTTYNGTLVVSFGSQP